MILADGAERITLGLSALASTKSTSIVDNAVIDAIQEYYQTDAITFTAQDDGDILNDSLASWLTELFKLRAKKNGFWSYHIQSLKCGLVDGLEAGMVRWRKESYKYNDNHFFDLRTGQEIPEEIYKEMKKEYPLTVDGQFDPATGKPSPITIQFDEHFKAERQKKDRIVADTWECVQLKPGENLIWDMKNPIMDLNRGQYCIVLQEMTKEDILSISKMKIFNPITEDELKPYLTSGIRSTGTADYTDTTSVATDPVTVDTDGYNTAEVWMAFERRDYQWRVTFSLKGEVELSDEKLVNDVFFGGRPFDRLPVFMGVSDFELWECLGRGIPKLIAPIEDEHTDHRNNVNDMGKQASTGKYRINPGYDDDEINSILNDKYFYAAPGAVEKLDFAQEMSVVLKAADMTDTDIASLVPVDMSNPHLIGKGNATDTLGAVQLAQGGNDKKLNTRLLIRNITVVEPMLRIIAEMHMAFETSQTIGRIAAKKAKMPPEVMGQITSVVDNKQVIDFSKLDFDADIQINAGLGTVPKQQKVAKMLQAVEWAKQHKRPIDIEKVWEQVMVLSGFNPGQFDPQQPPPPEKPPVDYKLGLNLTFEDVMAMAQLAGVPQQGLAQYLMKLMMEGHMDIDTKIKESAEAKKRREVIKELGQPGAGISQPGTQGNMPVTG